LARSERDYLTAQAALAAVTAAPAASACLLINPTSYRVARGSLLADVERLANSHGTEIFRASTLAEFYEALDLLRARRQQRLLVLSGDGTAHAVAQYLARANQAAWSPELMFLAGGRANIVPRDGGGYPAMKALRKVLAATREQRALAVEELPLLQVEQEGSESRQGFVFAAAMFDAGVRICAEHRARGSGWLHRSWIADPYALLRLGCQVMAGRSPLPAYPQLTIRTAQGASLAAPMRLVTASTLPLRNSLFRPFAPRGSGAVQITAVSADAAKFWRRLPAMIRGRFSAEMNTASGYLSERSDAVVLQGLAEYSLDGEPVSCDPNQSLRLTAGIKLRLLRV
jgi:Diacylglycerol kinase catalytic domain